MNGSRSGSKRRLFENNSEAAADPWDDDDDDDMDEGSPQRQSTSEVQTLTIAREETRRVRFWRGVLSVLLLAIAAAVMFLTFTVLTNSDQTQFQNAFEKAATTMTNTLKSNSQSMVDSLQSRSEGITSMTMAAAAKEVTTSIVSTTSYNNHNSSRPPWPFVTIPHFEVTGASARRDTMSELYCFAPIVTQSEKTQWEAYSVAHQDWILQARGIDATEAAQLLPQTSSTTLMTIPPLIPTNITKLDGSSAVPYTGSDKLPPEYSFVVNWQLSPPPALTYTINLDLQSVPLLQPLIVEMMETQQPVISNFCNLEEWDTLYDTIISPIDHNQLHHILGGDEESTPYSWEQVVGTATASTTDKQEQDVPIFTAKQRPHSVMMTPIFDRFTTDNDNYNGDSTPELATTVTTKQAATTNDSLERAVVGFLWTVIPWDWQFAGVLPSDTLPISVVLDNSCGSTYTYQVSGSEGVFLGSGDLHETEFDNTGMSAPITTLELVVARSTAGDGDIPVDSSDGAKCQYVVRIYPTTDMRSGYATGQALLYTLIMGAVFLLTAIVFLIYVGYVGRRQDLVMATAIRTSAIVSSLFPANVRERIMKDAENQAHGDVGKGLWSSLARGESAQGQLSQFLGDSGVGKGDKQGFFHDAFKSKPIADLFPEATVMFADLVGFTAWSSEREPTQVFQLLETLYHAFDTVAKRRRVFKVETIGDCYVAVTGLPEPRKDHAVAMCRFAKDCMNKMKILVVKLEVPLGPGTGDLSMRFGLHSGPVTAGVLRGEKSRFQLFGDTVNTAARMESNGMRERIHISQECADLLIQANKGHWLQAREEKIKAKGKGELQTYWLEIGVNKNASEDDLTESGDSASFSDSDEDTSYGEVQNKAEIVLDERNQRLVDWVVDKLSKLVKQILARRRLLGIKGSGEVAKMQILDFSDGGTVLDEVKDIVNLVPFDSKAVNYEAMASVITLPSHVLSQLRDYVATIATLHNNNQFHGFPHATHVTMSVVKLLSRIVSAEGVKKTPGEELDQDAVDRILHNRSYGIKSDPLAQFAVVFSGLIHDVDHPGVTNAQLVKENAKVAKTYSNKSVSEQNSVDLAWYLFMDELYSDLRGCIYHDEEELLRFRQLVVNSIIATDIADKELKFLRDARWENAFADVYNEDVHEANNAKATVMIDTLMQASDISHTMQHWHVYRKWNEKLFRELYVAFLLGRADKHPKEFWYDGEIGFFDFYIIPLAKKLKNCGVFGVSSAEYLNYAVKNRNEWASRGKQIVEEYIEGLADIEDPVNGDDRYDDKS